MLETGKILITNTSSIEVRRYGDTLALVFAGIVAVPLRSHADCREIIRIVALAEADMPCDYWPSLTGPALAGYPDGAA